MPQNDMRDMGRDLALSDPFMQIGTTIAKVGELAQSGELPKPVLDAYDYIKSHVSSGGKAIEDAANTLKSYLTTTAPAKKTQVGPYQVEHVSAPATPKSPAKVSGPSVPKTFIPDEEAPASFKPDEDAPKAPGSGLGAMETAFQGIKDFGIGAVKGAAHTAIDLGSAIHMIPGVSKAVDTLYGTPGLSQQAFPQAREETAYSNPTQRLGGAAETIAEMAIPVDAGVQALPSAARAGAKFSEVMGAARHIPVNVEPAGQAALRIQQLAERGGRLPKPVNDFLKYVTNPEKPALTYEAARDFASNLGRLSVNERQQLTPVVQREVAIMTGNLAKSVAEAANKAGKGQVYAQAMKEYARSKQLEGVYDAFLKGAQKSALPAAVAGGAAGAGYWLTSRLKSILGEGE